MKNFFKRIVMVATMLVVIGMFVGCPHNTPKPEPEYKEPARYTVSFHKNDTNAKGSMDPQTFVEGVEQKLTPNLFDLTNHEFKGWALTPEGDKKYIDQQSITVSSDLTLYAVWEQKICTITFEKNADDAVGSMNSQQLENSIPERISKNTFTRPNFEFLGWATSPDGEKVYEDNQEISLRKSITLYAKWAREIVYVSFEKNAESATGEMEPQSFGAGDPLTLKPNAFENTGYKFAGWALTADGTKQYDDAEKITITANTTLYALWEVDYKKVTVTHWQQNLADDGYTEVIADKTEHDVQITKEFTATAKTYTGFKLKTTPTPITINGDMTIPVYYDREVYTLTLTNFDASYFTAHEDLVGASLQGNTLTGRYGAEISALNDNKKIRREKYVFLSWKPIIPSTLTSNGTHTASWDFFEMKTGPEINKILTTLEHANCSFVPSNLAPKNYSGSKKLTTDNSTKHCYVWKDGNSIYYYAEGYTNGSKLIPLNADSSKMFSNLKFVNIDLSKFNTSKVTNMSSMFYNCNSLTSLDLSSFDTSKVTNMRGMFYNCNSLTSLDLSSFDTSKVTNMRGMFNGCNKLTSLDLSKFNTSNVTSMSGMFGGCSSLTSLDLSSFNTSNVTNMSNMFSSCSSLTSLDLSSFDTSNVTNMSNMFSSCSSLTSLDLSSFNTSKVINMNAMFSSCSSLTSLDLSSFDTSNVTGMLGMFSGCSSLTSLDLSSFNTSNVTSMSGMFGGCSSLTSLDLSKFNTSNVTDMLGMFSGCSSLTSLDLSSFNTSNVTSMFSMFYDCNKLTNIDLSSFNTSNVTSMYSMFYGCSSLTSLDLSSFNTSKVTNMSSMFYNCSLLTSIYVKPNTDWSTSSVLDSSTDMFYGTNLIGGNGTVQSNYKTDKTYACVDGIDGKPGYFTDQSTITLMLKGYSINSIIRPLSHGKKFKPSSVAPSTTASSKTISHPLAKDKVLVWQDGDVLYYYAKGFTDSGVGIPLNQDSSGMFENTGFIEIDLSGFDSSKVTNMSNMFYVESYLGSKLTTIDLSNFNTSNVTNMGWMFNGCSSLTSLDLTSFDTSNVTDMNAMFADCSSLTSIYVKPNTDWSTSSILASSTYMFTNCTNLIGGNGTVFNTNKTDKAYARVDGLNGKPGYFIDSNFGINTIISAKYINAILRSFSSVKRFKPSMVEPPTTAISKTISNPLAKDKYVVWQDEDILYYYAKGFTDSGIGIPLHQNSSAMFQNTGFIEIDLSGFDTSNVSDMSYMFSNCASLTSLDLSSFDTSNVTNMSSMFNGCNKLTNIDLSSFDTSNVTNLSSMFNGCNKLTNIDLSSFNTSNVTNLSSMFNGCNKLTNIDLSSFDTSNVTSMNAMFNGCSSLTSLDLSSFNTSNVTNMRYMFDGCAKLTNIGLSSFNTSNVTDMSYMFYYCSLLTSLDLSSFDTSKVTDMSYMFYNCSLLTNLDLSSFNTSKVFDMNCMFYDCSSLTTIGVKPNTDWSTSSSLTYSNYMFTGCKSLVGGNGTVFDTNKTDKTYARVDRLNGKPGYFTDQSTITLMLPGYSINNIIQSLSYGKKLKPSSVAPSTTASSKTISHLHAKDKVLVWQDGDVLYYYAKGFTDSGVGIPLNQNSSRMFLNTGFIEIDLSGFDTSNVSDMSYMFSNCASLTSLDLSSFDTSNVTNMSSMFNGCNKLTNIDLSSFNTSNVTSMSSMFSSCSSLTSLDLSKFDTSNVTNMSSMFSSCSSLTSLDLSSFNTSNVTNMSSMFYGCNKLTNIDLSSFNTSNVTDMSSMFSGCRYLSNLDLSSFNTSNVTDMSSMFNGCWNLTSLDLSSFNTSNVTDMSSMFSGCSRSPDLSSFNTSNVTNMSSMFSGCRYLSNLDLSSFNTSNVTNMSSMFSSCSSLTSLDLSSFNTSKVTSMGGMFSSCSLLTSIYVKPNTNWSTSSILTNSSDMFYNCRKLLGGNGTVFDASRTDKTYARVDGLDGKPGYFTAK